MICGVCCGTGTFVIENPIPAGTQKCETCDGKGVCSRLYMEQMLAWHKDQIVKLEEELAGMPPLEVT